MSGTDYTQTPNLGLYKPLYNADAEQWGFHLNANADVLDAAVGSSVNVLAFGADPTGVADSSSAINEALSQVAPNGRGKSAYLPAGTYHIRNTLALSGGQTLYGDGRGNTIITISDDFNPMAMAVITLAAAPITASPQSDPGPCVRDLYIQFAQPQTQNSRANFKTLAAGGTSAPGGTGVMYPWAVAVLNNCRPRLSRLRIGGAWDGITTNGVNASYWLEDIEMGALDCGLSLGEGASGVYDWCHINGYHFWPFDLDIDPLITGVYSDLQTIAMRVGAQNGLEARGIVSYEGRVVFTAASVDTWAAIANLNLDNNGARLEIATCRFMEITNLQTVADNSTGSQVEVDGGIVSIVGWYGQHANQASLEVTGGDVTVSNTRWQQNNTVAGCAFVTGGTLRLSGVSAQANVTGAWSQPLIGQFGAGVLTVDGVAVTGVAGSGGLGINYYTDNPGNLIGAVTTASGWTVNHVAGQLGDYGITPPMANFANDAAAAAGGVAVGQLYRNGSVLQVRVA